MIFLLLAAKMASVVKESRHHRRQRLPGSLTDNEAEMLLDFAQTLLIDTVALILRSEEKWRGKPSTTKKPYRCWCRTFATGATAKTETAVIVSRNCGGTPNGAARVICSM